VPLTLRHSDPDANLYRKAAGREARLSYMGYAVMENCHGLAVAGTVSQADGTAVRRASEALLKRKAGQRGRRITARTRPMTAAIM
jgi:hypothetical protein